MTEVEFHTAVAEPLQFACRLLRKAVRQGARVQVTAPAATLQQLDRLLWTFEEREFVPHVRMPGAAETAARRTPVWLATAALADGAPVILVNLGADLPTAPETLERVIEVVADDADEAARGRERWRAYKALGLSLKHHDAGARGG
jgi:DNA polymerase-3 subunit chi